MTPEELEREEPEIVDVEPVARRPWLRWLFVLGTLLIVGGAAWVVLSRIFKPPAPIRASEATDVRSDITQQGDSLDVVVDWNLTNVPAQGVAESVRVEVGLDSVNVTQVSTVPAEAGTDTLRIPAPDAGQSASGYSCVAAILRGRLTRETCTPWQYVRPAAQPPGSGRSRTDSAGRRSRRATGAATRIRQVVVQPSGLQVDPDVGGRCASWQRNNPGKSVWLDVNFRAVVDCTGPNGKPTVAQFCAFAVLDDGRRVKLENAMNSTYCERLFREWSQERVT